jgi:DNA repair exonuclease SbcCD ATPase subunit
MSESRDAAIVVEPEVEDDADQEVEDGLETPEEDGEDGEPPAKSADWEAKYHDKEGAMHRERSRRRAAERQVAELNERIERIEAATVKRPTASKREQLIASLRTDQDEPLTDLEAVKEIARTLLEEQQQEQQQAQQAEAQQRKINLITRSMGEFEADFRDQHKDYDAACEFFKNSRTEELEDLGYVGERLMRKLSNEVYGLVEDTIKAGKDPAEAIYNLAKRRGFTAGKDDATRKLQKLQNGAKAGVTPRGGSPNGTGRVTYEQVTRAKGADRDKLWSALRKQEMGLKT